MQVSNANPGVFTSYQKFVIGILAFLQFTIIFMLMPFGSAFSVHNLGISLEQLPLVYLITGSCSILAGPYIGKLAEWF